jgi:hypothetical protein
MTDIIYTHPLHIRLYELFEGLIKNFDKSVHDYLTSNLQRRISSITPEEVSVMLSDDEDSFTRYEELYDDLVFPFLVKYEQLNTNFEDQLEYDHKLFHERYLDIFSELKQYVDYSDIHLCNCAIFAHKHYASLCPEHNKSYKLVDGMCDCGWVQF